MTETVRHMPIIINVWKNEPNGEYVASLPGDLYPDDSTEYVRSDVANDMLEALKAAIANSDANIGPYGRTSEAQAVYDQVSDAIDKAEGRSHG